MKRMPPLLRNVVFRSPVRNVIHIPFRPPHRTLDSYRVSGTGYRGDVLAKSLRALRAAGPSKLYHNIIEFF
jgi:hypothetical protein